MFGKPNRDAAQNRDFATLLRMGWSPDSVAESVEIARELLSQGDLDGAVAAAESARSLAAELSAGDERTAGAVEGIAFEVAMARGDAPRVIAAANALRGRPGALARDEIERLKALVSGSTLRAELRQALVHVLDTVVPAAGSTELSAPDGGEPPADAPDPGESLDKLPYLFADSERIGAVEAGMDSVNTDWDGLPEGAADPVPDGAAADEEGAWLNMAGAPAGEVDERTFGRFEVGESEAVGEIRERFLEAARFAASGQARDACEVGWSWFVMEDFEAAALLFDQSLGDPSVRVIAAEGLVRCRLNLSQAGEAVAFLERLAGLAFRDGLPEPLMYWYGRAAEAAGDFRKARSAYRTLTAAAFPDVPGRLAALP